MKTVAKKTMPRPNHVSRQTPRTRTAAASEMVRLEFERDRLNRDIEVLSERRKVSEGALSRINKRLKTLQSMLSLEDEKS
ncbi:MAG: hypothetical protein AAFR27_07650 [Pseudomonadota bacterium]